MEYNFKFEEKEYKLNKENLIEIINDEENPIEEINIETILELLQNSNNINFEKAYYAEPCDSCSFLEGEEKVFPFLEYQFYINTKDSSFVTSNISKDSEEISFNKLKRLGKVDTSYIVFLEVCENCGEYFVVIEKVEE